MVCNANEAVVLYAFINPGTPNKLPPKYLTTIIKTSVIFFESIAFNIGLPAEPFGSPASELLKLVLSKPILYAKQKCEALGCKFFTSCRANLNSFLLSYRIS